jgi:glutamate-ammonia-ligase adenylyltransferase
VRLPRPPDLPAPLAERYERVAARVAELEVSLPPPIATDTTRALVVSDFVLGVLLHDAEALLERLADPGPLAAVAIKQRLNLAAASEGDAMRQLRRLRQVEMARIAWRDIARIASLDATLADVSLLADCLIDSALEHAAASLEPRFGRPRDEHGRLLPLLVLGMGKLGGHELNFSSDVDLVFLYPDSAADNGSGVEAETYYTRLAQLLIKLLDQRTEDGFAYRVDTRLRPFGGSGPLVVGLGAFEAYLV